MSFTLSPELEKRIQERVEAGAAPSVQAFVERAVTEALELRISPGIPPKRRRAADLIGEIWKDIPKDVLEKLPVDGAEQVDHYVYGVPKRP